MDAETRSSRPSRWEGQQRVLGMERGASRARLGRCRWLASPAADCGTGGKGCAGILAPGATTERIPYLQKPRKQAPVPMDDVVLPVKELQGPARAAGWAGRAHRAARLTRRAPQACLPARVTTRRNTKCAGCSAAAAVG